MGIKVNKKQFLKELNFKNVYCVLPGPNLVEHLLTGDQYNYFLNCSQNDYEVKKTYKQNLPLSTVYSAIKVYSLDIKSLIKKYRGYAGNTNFLNTLKNVFDNITDDEKNIADFYESAFNEKLFILSEVMSVKSKFARTEKEFFDFFAEKEYYSFNEETGAIEMMVTKPTVRIRELNYLYNETNLEVGFELEINGKTFTEEDLYFYNDRFYLKNVFENKDLLIDYHVKRLKGQLDYFETLRGNDPEGMLVSNKNFVF